MTIEKIPELPIGGFVLERQRPYVPEVVGALRDYDVLLETLTDPESRRKLDIANQNLAEEYGIDRQRKTTDSA